MKKVICILSILIIVSLLSLSCSHEEQNDVEEKPKILWLDAKANFKRFSNQDTIRHYLDVAKSTGFNEVVVDVRPMQGDVLYKSEILQPLTSFGDGYTYERDWDYLQFFIEESKKRDLKVTVSVGVLPAGQIPTKTGTAYNDESWDDKICVSYTKEGLKKMKETDENALFLNPSLSFVKEFVVNFITEIVSNYDFDALALDYCRYKNADYDFSDSSRVAFEKFINKKVEKFPEDIFTFNEEGTRIPGKYYKQWWEFRSTTITNLVTDIRKAIKKEKPNMKLTYWAASWIHAIYANGQNWASEKYYDPSLVNPEWASKTYKHTGFANQLDIFMLGSYLTNVYGLDNNESIEYAIERAYNLIGDECTIYGTIYGENNKKNMEDAVYVCLTQTEGLMVFDIVQVIKYNLWDDIKKGIERAENNPSKT